MKRTSIGALLVIGLSWLTACGPAPSADGPDRATTGGPTTALPTPAAPPATRESTTTGLPTSMTEPTELDPTEFDPTELEPTAGSATAGSATAGTAPAVSAEPAPAPSTATIDQATLDHLLREAAWADDVPRAAELIAQGADVNAKDDTQQSAYLIATSEGYLDLLELTLAHGALIDDKDSWNGTGLIRAAERGHALVVGRLLRAGIDRDHVNRIGYQAVHEAVYLGDGAPADLDTVRVLVAGGVELTRPSGGEGLTPLEMAVDRGFGELAATLELALSAAAFDDPSAALRQAATDGDADRAAVAVRSGADLESRDELGRTALLLAATADQVEVARLLVALGADPDALDGRHDTPWLVTGVTGSVSMLETLLPAHPDLTIVNRFGGTSLIPAAERGHVEYVRRAVSTGIDLNHVNDPGWTALLEAVVLGDGGPDHQEIVRLLLAAGADPTIADSAGATALELARARGHQAVADLLLAAGG